MRIADLELTMYKPPRISRIQVDFKVNSMEPRVREIN